MAAPRGPVVAAVLLLVSWGLLCSSSSPACPHACTCHTPELLNCSSAGLSSSPQHFLDSVAELDLSHNLLSSVTLARPHYHLGSVWLGNNRIKYLSLCMDRNYQGQYVSRRRRWAFGVGLACVSWAPTLQLLSVERNLLQQLPQGLENLGALEVLQLSFNRIASLLPEDLSGLRGLRELHLQHNLITSLHPDTFKDLVQLRVADLSFNLLTSLQPSMYLALRNIGADVQLAGNRWRCDCSMRSLRRRMAYDSSSTGLRAWHMVCASPSGLLGRDLQQVEEDELECDGTEDGPELHRDVTVHRGSKIRLACPTPDSMLLTPSNQSPVNQPLLISNITERDTGLYVCVSEGRAQMYFNLELGRIGGAKGEGRSSPSLSLPGRSSPSLSLPGSTRNQNQRAAAQSDLTLAVCLSVFITFLVAFILGVLARPCIDVLWKKVTRKKDARETESVSSAEKSQYDNEAYASGEDPQEVSTGRERRVTFSTVDFVESQNVLYYDTVARGAQEADCKDVVIECEVFESERRPARDSESDTSSQRYNLEDGGDAGRRDNVEFEAIPDSVELEETRRRSASFSSSSSSSDSSLSGKRLKQGETTVRVSVQQTDELSMERKVEVSQISTEGKIEVVEFTSEPFSDWSPQTNAADFNISTEIEEQFEFSDSGRSTSVRSTGVFGSFSDQKQNVELASDRQRRGDTSSSSSEISEDEITHYIVNSDQDTRLELESHRTDPIGTTVGFIQSENRYDRRRPGTRLDHSSSDSAGSSDEERGQRATKQQTTVEVQTETNVKVTPVPRQRWRDLSSSVISRGQSPDTRPRSSSSSSSDSERKTTNYLSTRAQTNKQLNVSAPLSDSSSSSSDERADETKERIQRETTEVRRVQVQELQRTTLESSEKWPVVDLEQIPRPENHLNIKASSPATDSSSSSDSEDEITDRQRPDNLGLDAKWPSIDLQHIPQIQRRLDVRFSSPKSDSSSSCDSEDDAIKQINKQDQWVNVSRPPVQVSPELQTQRPVVDLKRAALIKTRLDIRAPSAASGSSSSSDSEDGATGHTNKQTEDKVRITQLQSQTSSYEPGRGWPALDLQRVRPLKRRLDIKPSLPLCDSSSSSSDSEDETIIHSERWEQRDLSQRSDAQWPVVDLHQTKHVKRRLDIKAPSPSLPSDSSSGSDRVVIKKQDQGNLYISRTSTMVSQTVTHGDVTQKSVVEVVKVTPTKRRAPTPPKQRPPLQVEQTTYIERQLDVKAPSASSDSSSSSDSEDETIKLVEKQEQAKLNISRPLIEATPVTQQAVVDVVKIAPVKRKAPTPPHQSSLVSIKQISTVDLEHTTRIERRLDIKAPLPSSDSSSSSSDSENEATKPIKKQDQGNLYISIPSTTVSQTVIHGNVTQQPVAEVMEVTLTKRRAPIPPRRLDVKAPSAPSDSSSSSDSKGETQGQIHKQTTEKLLIARIPSVTYPNGGWPLVDLQRVTRLKRSLDIKGPLSSSDSSSSSDSEDELMHTGRQEQKSKLPIKVSPTQRVTPETEWPSLDLQQTTRVNRRLDIKARPQPSDTSSSSHSEVETEVHVQKQTAESLHITRLPSDRCDPNAGWPLLDLQKTTRIKRRLDIKAPTPSSDSSSSSSSEDETSHIIRQEKEELHVARPSMKVSPTVTLQPEAHRSTVDLQRTIGVKRRLDIKAPTPSYDSSSSSSSEDETTSHVIKQEKEELHVARPSIKVSSTVNLEPEAHRSTVDLQRTIDIKRRLDIKAPSPPSDSSSSSDSEEEIPGRVQKQTTERIAITRLPPERHNPNATWPLLNLRHIFRVKRRLDFRVLLPSCDSPVSSHSKYEVIHIKKQEQGEMQISRLPLKGSQTQSFKSGTLWPLLDLQRTTRVKRRLDVKAPIPSSDSSSSSDSENETTRHTNKTGRKELHVARPRIEVSQTGSQKFEAHRSVVHLNRSIGIKRRLDIKPPSPPSDTSSSGDSQEETQVHVQKQTTGNLGTTRIPSKGYDPNAGWPLLDLQKTTRIKRRLDIKAPTPSYDSSSSSSSEDETTSHIIRQEKGELHVARPSTKVSPTVTLQPEAHRSTVDLQHTIGIKRRLDIKAPSPPSDTSSSSDSEVETLNLVKKNTAETVTITRLPPGKFEPNATWPVLDLQHISRLKRRFVIKVQLPLPDSSSSSDSEDEATIHIKKQEQWNLQMSRLPPALSPTQSFKPETQWPLLNLQKTAHIKRRLDVKVAHLSSDSSSSSDSEEETQGHVQKQTTGSLGTTKIPSKGYDPNAGWPLLNLQQNSRLKRRLDIKVHAPLSDSSSSSDSEDETHIKKHQQGELQISRPPIKLSPAQSFKTGPQWPLLDLQRTRRIKRHLDIKAPSPFTHSSSSDSEDETSHKTKWEKGKLHVAKPSIKVSQTVSIEPEAHRFAVDLQRTIGIKRRLDVKGPSPPSGAFSGSDSEEETRGHIQKPELNQTAVMLGKTRTPTGRYYPGAGWPLLDLQNVTQIKRRLDIKAPSPQTESSSSSSEDESTGHIMKKLSRTTLPSQTSQRESHVALEGTGGNTIYTREIKREGTYKVTSSSSDEQEEVTKVLRQPRLKLEPNSESRWSDPGFSSTLGVKRRLDIKTISHSPASSSSSDARDEWRTGTTVRVEGDKSKVGIMSYRPGITLPVPYKPYISRRLDIRAPSPQPVVGLNSSSLQPRKSGSSSSSDSEDDKKDGKTKVGKETSFISTVSEKRFAGSPENTLINISGSSKKDPNIRLKTYTSTSDLRSEPTSDNTRATHEINPELQSRWATMNLGYSRSRLRPVSTQLRESLPSSPPPDSSHSSSGESGTRSRSSRPRQRLVVGTQEITQPDFSLVLRTTPSIVSSRNSFEVPEASREDYSLLTTEVKSYKETSSVGFEIPQVKRYLDIKINEKSPTIPPSHRLSDSSSSSSGKDEVDHITPNLSRGVPRLKRRLNIKAPSPEPSTTPPSSEGENRLTGVTDDSRLTYKRLIMKAPSLPIDSSSFTSQTDRNALPAPRRVASMSSDDTIKRKMERSQLNANVPSEIRWTGIGYHLPDLSSTTDRRGLSATFASPQPTLSAKPAATPHSSSDSSSSDSEDEVKQGSRNSKTTITSEYTSRSVYSPIVTTRTVTVDSRERKGLGALKLMSSERQIWDTENLDKGAPLLVGDPQNDISFNYRRSELDVKPLSKEALSSTSVYERETTDLLHPIPSYRRHDLLEPPHEAPPPIPTSPLPEEELMLTWRSPPSVRNQEWEVQTISQQRSPNTNLIDLTTENLAMFLDSPNISEV